MNVLGISCYFHDAAAVLVRDGKVIAAAEEERFSRKKHDNAFPEASIAYCLREGKIRGMDLDLVCFYEKPIRKLERVLTTAKKWGQTNNSLLNSQLSLGLHERLWLPEVVKDKIGYNKKVLFCEHHLSHAAASYYISNFDDAAILTIDGVGEFATTAEFLARGTEIKKTKEIHYPHSLGLIYSTITAFLGFKVNNDEYKVMGLASYGTPSLKDKLQKLFIIHSDGSYELDLSYFSFMYDEKQMYSEKFIEEFGKPRIAETEILPEHINLAASLQELLEEALVFMGNKLYERSGGTKNVCLSGGVALNSVANWRFINETPFEQIAIQPAAGDSGCAMGAALYAYYQESGANLVKSNHSTLLGPDYSNDEIEELLKSRGAIYQKLSEPELCKRAAELISKNYILGWFQGRMEFGPRALGSRSIIANACNPEMKEILNSRVKFREDFRPFAPAVLADRAEEYFDINFESPYMLFVPQVKPGKGELIPSVTHTDNSARVQTVDPENNPRFYKLIDEFSKISGIPVVINTSFNIRGEPIVCSPYDAYECFLKTDIDYLFMGDYLIEKLV